LKASNFPASLLRIGRWEYKSRHEGDLVAKCYFAKHKIVWEVLEGGLKSKIEIQWSDIMGLKANIPENEPATLNVGLARQPLFFRETNPQPRKHTLWQATSDFTDGQASTHRLHFLQCPQGMLDKHFEKLVQCDMRLNFLSRQPEIVLDPPYFESRPSLFEDPSESINSEQAARLSGLSRFQERSPTIAAHSSSLEIDNGDPASMTSERTSREAPSPNSDLLILVTGYLANEGSGIFEPVDSKGPRNWDHIKVPGLHPSMSMTDLMNHIGNRLSEQKATAGNHSVSANETECDGVLENLAQYLLSDTQLTAASDEKCLMSRVNSLCSLLQKDHSSAQNLQAYGESCSLGSNDEKEIQLNPASNLTMFDNIRNSPEGDVKNASSSKHVLPMSRKDSFSDLLQHLPRIASLPKFLFNITEDGGS
ncbi:uncharacterized protein, partial [Rutidosis leptorrhynchoides]|uniref:uncharacterized protein n=1 Tax=Rutidosis leptorrhynchoides TaxID=125765 RepID=UPI003A9A3602